MRAGWAIVAALLVGLAHGASADDTLTIDAFYGSFSGSGSASGPDSRYFGITERDFDVVIHKAGNGFSVAWTTLLRGGGNPDHPNVRKRRDKIVFVPTGTPNQWRAATEPDPMGGKPYAWARVEGQSLIIYLFSVDAEGRYDVQRYERSFDGPVMDLTFTDMRDGDRIRVVKGKLIKNAD